MKKSPSIILLLIFWISSTLSSSIMAQENTPPPDDPFAHTFSIVAKDPETGNLGVAVQSHWFSVGSVVSWARAGVGAVATQSFVNTSFGPRGLDLMEEGYSAQEALDILIENDEGRDYRQVGIVDVDGNVANYTGSKCVVAAGHSKGDGFSVQANMMLKNTVWGAMEEAYLNAEGSFADKLIASMKAAQQEGGDIRGQQSAALLIVRGESTGNVWEDVLVDLRVEDHPEAVDEIARLVEVHKAYEHMNEGDLAIEENDVDKALEEYNAAMELFPENIEMKYWTAVSLANSDRLDEALPLFKTVFETDKNWVEMTSRIVPNGLLQVTDKELSQILNAHK